MFKKVLPKPGGSCMVGSVTCDLTDTSRNSSLTGDDPGRRLFIKIWYPAGNTSADSYRRENLWEQLLADPATPLPVKPCLKFISRTRTNTYHQAYLAAEVSDPGVLIYNHGLISFASENTTLMENLASHGYIVIAIQHVDQLNEFRTLQSRQPAEQRQRHARMQKQLQQATGKERAVLSREYYLAAANTNQIAAARAMDTLYVVNKLDELLSLVPGMNSSRFRTARVGLIGLSLGGAVATEFAKLDNRAGFVVNLDGGVYGKHIDEPVTVPYLMMYSQDNDGCNDQMFNNAADKLTQRTIADSRHLNFHDIAMILPFLRWIKVTGKADPVAVIESRNRYVYEYIGSI